MKAIVIAEPGGPDVLRLREVERPEPGVGELLVAVASSGVNRADLLQRRGLYPAPPGAPSDIPGLEFAGTVEAVGPGVSGFEEGDRVMGLVGGGGYAEAVVVHHRTAVRVPEAVDTVDAGAIPEAFMTAFDAVFLQAGLRMGEALLIHAVGSGVGTAALQMAVATGARTVGTSRTPEKLAKARELGLHVPIAGGDRPWHDDVLEATGGEGVDAILDLVGGPYIDGNVASLRTGGRWIVVGVPGGAAGVLDLRAMMRRRASLTGTVLRARPLEEKAALARAFERQVLPLFDRVGGDVDAEGRPRRVQPVIDGVYAPDEVATVHRRMEENANFGKLLLAW